VAELVGTFALVFAGCGAVMVDAKTHALGHVGVAITFGLVIMAMIYAVGHISGAHFNPAVSLAFALSRHFPWTRTFAYWSAQLLGALAAAAVLRGSLGNLAHTGATLPSGSQGQSFLWELVLSFFLMFVIMAVATDTRAVGEAAAIAIGGTVGLDAMFGGPISGASMNPARSIGPALVSGELHALWLYIVAPIAGASLAALTYQLIRSEPSAPSTVGPAPAEREAREKELV
jgi:aquaporin NIP